MSAGQRAGYALEQTIIMQSQWLAAQRRAVLFKVPDPVKITASAKGAREVRAVKSGAVWTDFAGLLYGSGRAVALECKATSAGRWNLAAVATEHQIGTLSTVARAGGLAALVVRHCDQQGYALAGCDYLLPYSQDGHAMFPTSAAWPELAPWQMSSGEAWLDAAERLELCGQPRHVARLVLDVAWAVESLGELAQGDGVEFATERLAEALAEVDRLAAALGLGTEWRWRT